MINVITIALVLSSADTLLVVDFPEEGADWFKGVHWTSADDSFFLYLSHSAGAGPYFSDADSLVSPEFIVPECTGGIVVVFDHYWWGHGGAFEPQEWAKSTSELLLSSEGNTELVWEISSGAGDSDCFQPVAGYSLTDSGSVYVPLPSAGPGDGLTFTFRGIVEGDPYSGYVTAKIEWDVFSFMILSVEEESLDRRTWGSIKASL